MFVDESANVLHAAIRAGMTAQAASDGGSANGAGGGSPSLGGSNGAAGFAGFVAPQDPITAIGGMIDQPAAHRGSAHHAAHIPKPPHQYAHQIGHAPTAHQHHAAHAVRDHGPIETVAQIGTCTLVLDNSTQRYSPDYVSSPLFGNVLPRRPIRIQATDGVSVWTIFAGYIERITPDAGSFGARQITIDAVDALALLAFQRISLPLQQNQRADQLIAQIVAQTYTPAATNYRAGSDTFDIAADQWTADRTAALDAIRECAESEFGRFFVQLDGTPTFLNRRFFFGAITPALTLDASSPIELSAARDVAHVFNVIKVVTYPRATLSTVSALAQANSPVLVPPIGPSGAGVRIVTLHFHDAAGNGIGGTNLQTPLTAYADYALNEAKDGSKGDYTVSAYTSVSVIDVRGSEVTVQMTNSALGVLYATKLQIRGQAITTYDPLTQTKADAISQSAYQKRTWTHDLPLSADVTLADSLASYLLDRYAQPFTRVESITIYNDALIGGVNVFSVRLFDALSISDPQTGISAMVCRVIGLELTIAPNGFTLHWITERQDERAYWILGTSALGVATRLAV